MYVPLVETVMDCVVSPVDQTLPLADEEVNTTDPPSQKVVELPAVIVGVAGADGSLNPCESVLELHPAALEKAIE